MGYELPITRAESWSENDEARITADEWLAIVDSDPELSLRPENGPCFAMSVGSARGRPQGNFAKSKHARRAVTSRSPGVRVHCCGSAKYSRTRSTG